MKLHAFKETYGDGVHGHDERSEDKALDHPDLDGAHGTNVSQAI